jgi:SET domain-containing protein
MNTRRVATNISGETQTDECKTPEMRIGDTDGKGIGVFASGFIPAGTKIVEFDGHRCRSHELTPDCFALQIDNDWWLSSDGTLLDDCINHSCDPNVGFTHGDPVLYALRDITEGEELAWDYSTSINCEGWSLACLCKSKRCRGVILPFHELALEHQSQLRAIALRYLR